MTDAVVAAVMPDRDTFRALALQGNVIPVWVDLPADGESPVSLFQRLDGGDAVFLLESAEGDGQWAAHSFIGINPWLVLRARGGLVTITEGGRTRATQANSLNALHEILRAYVPVHCEGLPRFAGGAVGYFSYDTVRVLERLPEIALDDDAVPDALWMLPGEMVIFDNRSQRVKLVHLARVAEWDDPDLAYSHAEQRLGQLGTLIAAPMSSKRAARMAGAESLDFRANFTRAGFERAVESVQEHICAGDIFQMVLSQQFTVETDAAPFDVYRALRTINPSPYLYYFRFPELTIIGSSPELLLRLEGRRLTVRPIAGTRPRGATETEDRALEASLLADPKEIAEHVMLIDLGRNDVGRVAEIGSVRLVDRMAVERYSHVMHLVSSVTGMLAKGLDAIDAFRATFPAGTLTGAPKIRAMELIERFEPVRRGLYGGAVGYFSFNGDADLAIAIRSLSARTGTVTFQAGAGIVYDSVPAREYEETLHKAGALRRAIEMAHAGDVA
ncbi:MAG: anthranilate synthase component I [Gemmatimonadaceae bacterium]